MNNQLLVFVFSDSSFYFSVFRFPISNFLFPILMFFLCEQPAKRTDGISGILRVLLLISCLSGPTGAVKLGLEKAGSSTTDERVKFRLRGRAMNLERNGSSFVH